MGFARSQPPHLGHRNVGLGARSPGPLVGIRFVVVIPKLGPLLDNVPGPALAIVCRAGLALVDSCLGSLK